MKLNVKSTSNNQRRRRENNGRRRRHCSSLSIHFDERNEMALMEGRQDDNDADRTHAVKRERETPSEVKTADLN